MTQEELYEILEEKAKLYNATQFIETDPIQIPHSFSNKENKEIAGFFAATIAWGNRKMIIKNALKWMELMDNNPYEFLMNTSEKEWLHLDDFKHRTFNGTDCKCFLRAIKNIYSNHGGLEQVFTKGYQQDNTIASALRYFRAVFFDVEHEARTHKHVSNIDKGASAKRLNMYLRWMVRKDTKGVDLGLWNKISMSNLLLPLDVHTSRQARELGLLKRKQDDWKAVIELTQALKKFDPNDPIKYDFALFGIGAFE